MSNSGDILNDVLFGQDGWMFLWQGGQKQFEHLMGKPPTYGSVEAFIENLLSRKEICSARNIPFVHVVFPSKPVLMKAKLPKSMQNEVRSLFDRHYRAPALNKSLNLHCIYPDELLKQACLEQQIYSQHDSHMTAFGDAIVSQEIVRVLGWKHNPLHHMDPIKKLRSGDLAGMAKIRERQQEVFLIPSSRTVQVWDNRLSLPSNTDNVAVSHNPFSVSRKRLLALGDSFLRNCLVPLSTFFRDILYVRSAQFQPELLDLFMPDAVVTANAERYLCRVNSDFKAESVFMRGYGRADYSPTPDFCAALRAQLSKKNYPDHYRQWSHESGILSFNGIGIGITNEQIVIVKEQCDWLESIGVDPIIIFNDVPLRDGIRYNLKINLHSDRCSISQLFFGQEGAGSSFSEKNSIRIPIKLGKNILNFQVPATGRTQKLRFDPLNCPGKLRIDEIELTAL